MTQKTLHTNGEDTLLLQSQSSEELTAYEALLVNALRENPEKAEKILKVLQCASQRF